MDAIEREVTLPVDLEEAWDLLTRPEDLAGWLGAEVELDPTPGSRRAGRRPRRHRCAGWWSTRSSRAGASRGTGGTTTRPSRAAAWRSPSSPSSSGTAVRVVEELLGATPVAQAQAGEAWSHRLLHLEALLLIAAAVRG